MNKRIKKVATLRESSNLKNGENAITLIALVLTIIVLLILSAVTLNMVLGENGLFSKARQAKNDWQKAQSEEETQIGRFSNEIDSWTRAGGSNINYSTTEQDTGLKWIDGKSIYQKTITIPDTTGIVASNHEKDYTTDLNNIDELIYSYGRYTISDKWGDRTNPFNVNTRNSDNDSADLGYVFVEDNTIKLAFVAGETTYTISDIIVTVQYTKK